MSVASSRSLCHSLPEGPLWLQKDAASTGGAGQECRSSPLQETGVGDKEPTSHPLHQDNSAGVRYWSPDYPQDPLLIKHPVFSPSLPPLTTPLVLPEITSQITCVHVCAQSCPTLRPMDCSPPGSSVHGILQARYWSGLPCPPPPTCTQIPFGAPLLGGSQTEHFSLSERRNPGQKGLWPLFVTTPLLHSRRDRGPQRGAAVSLVMTFPLRPQVSGEQP